MNGFEQGEGWLNILKHEFDQDEANSIKELC